MYYLVKHVTTVTRMLEVYRDTALQAEVAASAGSIVDILDKEGVSLASESETVSTAIVDRGDHEPSDQGMEILKGQALAEFEEAGGVAALAAELLALSTQVEPDMGEGGEPSIDIRLRYHSGLWYLHSGDSSFDQDHRGNWGASCVTASMDADDAKSVAADLLDRVLEDMASH